MTADREPLLLRPNDPRWALINAQQEADDAARVAAMTIEERLDLGVRISRAAAELRRAAWGAESRSPER
jgi:hypothetical protein